MWFKRICLFIIIIGIYTSIMVEHPSPGLKALGYKKGLDWYGEASAGRVRIDILNQPGLQELNNSYGEIAAVIPGSSQDYNRLMDGFLENGRRAVVECSAMDAWHTTAGGQYYLRKMRGRTYRVVVFDGGHHLPTLGLAPDIIIMPLTSGYAAHARAMDGMKADMVAALAREAGCPAVIAGVSRWGLVKSAPSLKGITMRIIKASPVRVDDTKPYIKAFRGASYYGGICFAYIDHQYLLDQAGFRDRIDNLGMNGKDKICLAFDYRYTDVTAADAYCQRLSRYCGLPVERVNGPVKVANAILSWGVEKDELPQPGYSAENR